MSTLSFEFHWESGDGVTAPELRETMASLCIRVNGEPVTQLHDGHSRSVRDVVHISLYPLAEWFATQWFPLLFECPHPGRQDYNSRHLISQAREGFALPALRIIPQGEWVSLRWHRSTTPFSELRFLSDGEARLSRAELVNTLAEFVDAVVARIQASRLDRPTLLEEEWEKIRSLDADEMEFCVAAGAMGLDPFSTTDEVDARIEAIAGKLPASLHEEFYASAEFSMMEEQLAWIQEALSTTGGYESPPTLLAQMRALFTREETTTNPAAPWEKGYQYALSLRRELGLNGAPLSAQCIDTLGWKSRGLVERASQTLVALTAVDKDGEHACFVVSGRRLDSQRFAFARALYEYLTAPEFPRLVSQADTMTQKTSRAFAAEFLAPASAIRDRITGGAVNPDEMDDLAAHFEVSSILIEHQIRNHGIAEILSVS